MDGNPKHTLTDNDRKRIIQNAFWDITVEPSEIEKFLNGGPTSLLRFQKARLYGRLLSSCDWYTLLKLADVATIRDHILADDVLQKLKSRELVEKYRYARQVLSE